MSKVKTWDVVRWLNKPAATRTYSLCCPHCGTDAQLELGLMPGAQIIAAIGLGLIFEPAGYVPPDNAMPTELRCRTCRYSFTTDPEA